MIFISWELAVVIGQLGVSCVWLAASYLLNEEHWAMKWLFFFTALISLWGVEGQIINVVNAQQSPNAAVINTENTVLMFSIIVFIILIVYFIIWFWVKFTNKSLKPLLKV